MPTETPPRSSPKPPIGAILSKHQKKIQDRWLHHLSQSASRSAYVIALREIEEGHSLLSSLLGSLVLDEDPNRDIFEHVLRNVRHKAYSIADLFTEIGSLHTAVDEVLAEDHDRDASERFAASRRVRAWFNCVFGKVLSETSEIYEYVTESGGIGFCQMDAKGKVTFANAQTKRLLGDFALEGHCLEDFFDGEEAKFVREAVRGDSSVGRELEFQHNGAQFLVSADIGPLFLDGKKIGSYASLSDITSIIQRQRQIYELSPLAICRIDSCENFIYMNPAFKKLIGVEDYKGLNTADLLATDKVKLTEELGKRQEGLASQYELELIPINGRRVPIPVLVTGIPVMDSQQGVCGSLAIVRDLRVERGRANIHKLIERQQSGSAEKMLEEVAKEIRKLVDFDMFVVSQLSRDQAHTREVFTYLPNRDLKKWSKRWYHLEPDMIEWVVSDDPSTNIVDDFEKFMNQETWRSLLEDDGVKAVLDEGWNSFMRFRVLRKKRLIATVSLFLRGKGKFKQENWDTLDQLPLAEAVNAALYESRRQELQFRYNLISAIVGQQTITQVADLLVRMLGEHYKWQHVSIFLIDRANEQFRVIAEWHKDPNRSKISSDYTQAIDKGVLGFTLSQQSLSHVKSDDVKSDPKLKDIYIETVSGAESELCIPIEFDGKVRWMLDITDTKRAAFSDEEIDNLKAVVQEVASSLDNLVAMYRFTSAFSKTSDAVIITNDQNVIRQVNAAAVSLLGYSSADEAKAAGNSLADHIEDMSHLNAMDFIQSKEVKLKRIGNSDQDTVPALISAFELPYEIPGNVYAAKDLTHFNRIKALENLGRVFYELAIQTETPISLIFSWLRRLERRENLTDETRDLVGKITGQMRKVRITFDRLILHEKGASLEAGDKIKINLETELQRSMDDLPDADRKHIEIIKDKEISELPYIYADPYQISFVFQSILSYLLGMCPTKKKIVVKFAREDKRLYVDLSGFAPVPKQINDDVSIEIARIQTDIRLGEEVIRKFVENHDGYYRLDREGNSLAFHIELPILDARASA